MAPMSDNQKFDLLFSRCVGHYDLATSRSRITEISHQIMRKRVSKNPLRAKNPPRAQNAPGNLSLVAGMQRVPGYTRRPAE